jgi:hypothetical protein
MPAIRKPASIHRLQGTFRPDRHAPSPGRPAGSAAPLGRCPSTLAPAARAVWQETAKLAPWLRAADRQAVEVYSTLLAAFRADPAALSGRPLALMLSLGRGLGLVWADRQRQMPDPPSDAGTSPNAFADL